MYFPKKTENHYFPVGLASFNKVPKLSLQKGGT